MIKPKPLRRGDTIALIATSSPTPAGRIEPAEKGLQKLGFKVVIGESCYGVHGYLSGEDRLRAKDLTEMFRNKDIDGIWCIRGGYGASRILDMIDYDAIRQNPKVFIGYSDITALHIAFSRKCNMVTFHGPMASTEIFHRPDNFTKEYLTRNIMSNEPLGQISNPKDVDIKTLVAGKCEGRLIGGNLSLVAGTIGTPYEIDTKGKILFLEDVDERPYRIDRMLTQLKLSGKLDDAEGFVLGSWNNCVAEEPEKSLTLTEIFDELIVPIGKPAIYNLVAGHCRPMITLPFGLRTRLDADNKKLFIEEAATGN